jgi:hypothetical protein
MAVSPLFATKVAKGGGVGEKVYQEVNRVLGIAKIAGIAKNCQN